MIQGITVSKWQGEMVPRYARDPSLVNRQK